MTHAAPERVDATDGRADPGDGLPVHALLLRLEDVVVPAAFIEETLRPRATGPLDEWICQGACRQGRLRTEMHDDVLRGFARWRLAGLLVGVYSTIGAAAQRELFQCAEDGDVSSLVTAWYDARAGAPDEPDAYRAMAENLGHEPGHVLFVTSRVEEADAAAAAGMQVLLVERAGTVVGASHAHTVEPDVEIL